LAWAQQQQEWQQQEWLRQQAELQAQAQAQAQNDWAMQQMQLQQMQQMQVQQQALQQQQLQQQQTAWLQAQQTSPLTAQPTGFGSKNPFALSPASAVSPAPQLFTPAPSLSQAPSPSRSAPPTTSAVPTVKVSNDPENEALAALFANREGGTDTFGNIGNLRCALDFTSCLVILTGPQVRTHICWAGVRRDSHWSCPTERPAVLFRAVVD
jgi:epsin